MNEPCRRCHGRGHEPEDARIVCDRFWGTGTEPYDGDDLPLIREPEDER